MVREHIPQQESTFYSKTSHTFASHSEVYERLDVDESGSVDITELNSGLKKLLPISVRLSAEDFEEVTECGRWASESGELTADSFHGMIMSQLRRYTRRKVAEAVQQSHSDPTPFALKMILASVDQLQVCATIE